MKKYFFDESLTNNKLANELYISKSTLNRIANTIDEELKPYGLRLETSPYKITGNEQLIRNFFTTYIVEAYSPNEWPFENLIKEVIDEALSSVIDHHQSVSEVMNYTSFRFRFAVGLTRNLQGYAVEKTSSENRYLMVNHKKLSTEIEEKINHLPFDTLVEKNSYITELVNNQLLISRQVWNDRLQKDETLSRHLEDIQHMINFLYNHFEFSAEDQLNLVITLENMLSFLAKKTGNVQPKNYILYPPRDSFLVDLYQQKYSTFYDIVKYFIIDLCENRGFEPTDETVRYLIYSLLSKWKNLTKQLFCLYHAINVKIYSHLNIRNAQGLAEELSSDLPSSVQVSVLKESFVNEEILSKYNFDILVSTESLILDIEQPIVYMYKLRSNFQYDALYQLITETAYRKEKLSGEKFKKKYQALSLNKKD